MALSVVGTNFSLGNATDPDTTTISTGGQTNCIIVVGLNEQVSLTITNVTDTAGNTWAKKANCPSNAFGGELWWTRSATALSGATITVDYSGVPGSNAISAIAVAGAKLTGDPWDGTATATGGAGAVVGNSTYTTVNAETMVICWARFAGASGSATPQAGPNASGTGAWTVPAVSTSTAGNFNGLEVVSLSSIGTVTGDWATSFGANDQNGQIIAALIAEPAAGATLMGQICL